MPSPASTSRLSATSTRDSAQAAGDAERQRELGEDLGGEGLVAEDLERAVLGQQDQRDQQAAAQDRAAGLAERDPDERAHPADAEAARHLLLARVGGPQAGRHRQVDQRVDGQRHDQDRAAEAVHPGPQRGPAEADHEVGDGQRHHDQHRPDPPAGQVGPLDAPGGGGADDRAQHGDHDGEPDRVPQQLRGQRRKIRCDDRRGARARAPRSAGRPAAARAAAATAALTAISTAGPPGPPGAARRAGPPAAARPAAGPRPGQRLRAITASRRPLTAGRPGAAARSPWSRSRARRS